jgi:hypothetical protein
VSEATYPPRTVAIVALGSLIGGFVLVFGGGMLVLRPRSTDTVAPSNSLPPPSADAGPPLADPLAAPTRDASVSSATAPGGDEPTPPTPPNNGGAEPTTPAVAGSVTVGAPTISRCFDAGPPNPIPGANCGQLASLQQHIASRSTAVAECARGAHGRLALVLDFRFSTSFVRGWGSPASTIARAGDVTSCVKNAVLPLPFAQMPHDHDRYIVIVPIDF